jgi:hypothetical protein
MYNNFIFFFENRSVFEIMRKNIVQPDKTQVPIYIYIYIYIYIGHMRFGGSGSVVRITTDYGLDGPGIESQCGQDFPHLSRPAPGVHLASCSMGTGTFQGIKSGWGVTLTPHPLLVLWS